MELSGIIIGVTTHPRELTASVMLNVGAVSRATLTTDNRMLWTTLTGLCKIAGKFGNDAHWMDRAAETPIVFHVDGENIIAIDAVL